MSNTGYQQATIAYSVSMPGNEPLDIDGNFVRESGKKQAILLLEGFDNPDPDAYEVAGYFKAGDMIDGQPTRVYNPTICGEGTFTSDRYSLVFGVGKCGIGYEDTLHITSMLGDTYTDYTVISKPDWITASKGDVAEGVSTLTIDAPFNDTGADRTGEMLLTQNATGNEIRISLMQAGTTLKEGIPTSYPYFTELNFKWKVGDVYEPQTAGAVQIGEQIWMNHDFRIPGAYDTWGTFNKDRNYYWINTQFQGAQKYPWSFNVYGDQPLAAGDESSDPVLMDFWGSPDGGQPGQQTLCNIDMFQIAEEHPDWIMQAVFDGQTYTFVNPIYADQLKDYVCSPRRIDFREMVGFLVGNNWDGVTPLTDEYVKSITERKTIIKGALNPDEDPCDNFRFTYPAVMDRNTVLTGTDDYGLSFYSVGGWHRFANQGDTGGNLGRAMVTANYFLRDTYSEYNRNAEGLSPYVHDIMIYRSNRINIVDEEGGGEDAFYRGTINVLEDQPLGWTHVIEFTGFAIRKSYRMMKYAPIPFELYVQYDTDGVTLLDLIKKDKELPAPEGYQVLQNGEVRGAWFGKPDTYTVDQMNQMRVFLWDYLKKEVAIYDRGNNRKRFIG